MVTIDQLRRKYLDLPQDTILILCKLLEKDKSYIYTYGDEEIPREIEDRFVELIEKRKKGYPLQYLLGEWEFMGLNFFLKEGVLVPRPDTEILIEYIMEYIDTKYKNDKINILDLGIGSGAISLSIANYCKNAFVYGVDISPVAIQVANINKERFGLKNVNLHEGNLFEALKGESFKSKFHIIASNPPYIPRMEIDNLQVEVRKFEPRLALDGGLDGLDFYRKITKVSKDYLVDEGLLIYEIGYDQGDAVKNILAMENFHDIEILKDLEGHNRVVLGILKNSRR